MSVLRKKQFMLSGIALALSACGSSTPLSSTKGAVTLAELKTAVKTINLIDYLPFTQVEDGCYARSLYMAMELAVQGIPVSSQFVIATTGSLNPRPGFLWNYHVAPAVWVKDSAEPSILDPAMFNHVASRSAWIKKLNPTGNYVLKFAPASETVANSSSLKNGPQARSEMITSAADIGEFRVSDITNSCRTMESSIKQEDSLSTDARELKVARLTKRTKFLLSELRKLGLGPGTDLISDDPNSCY
jgi:hypothetical protein